MFVADNIASEVTSRILGLNSTGSEIAARKLVAIAGYDGTTGYVQIQLADNTVSSKMAFGYTEEAIANGATGCVVTGGIITTDTSSLSVGNPFYLGTSGNPTSTMPDTGVGIQEVGRVLSVGASGKVFFRPQTLFQQGGNAPYISTILFDTGTDAFKTVSCLVTVVGEFVFPGTSVWKPSTVKAIANKSRISTGAYVALYDKVSGLQINASTLSIADVTPTLSIVSSGLQNLPSSETIFEIRATAGASSPHPVMYLFSIQMR